MPGVFVNTVCGPGGGLAAGGGYFTVGGSGGGGFLAGFGVGLFAECRGSVSFITTQPANVDLTVTGGLNTLRAIQDVAEVAADTAFCSELGVAIVLARVADRCCAIIAPVASRPAAV